MKTRSEGKLFGVDLYKAYSLKISARNKAALCLFLCKGSTVNLAKFTWLELNIILTCLVNQPHCVNQVRLKLLWRLILLLTSH